MKHLSFHCILLSMFSFCILKTYQTVTIVGSGYVGLTTAAMLAEFDHTVICADIDETKIRTLQQGIIPLFEPGLQEMLARHNNHISYTTDISNAIQSSNVIVIAVGTPSTPSGEADLSAISSVLQTISHNLNSFKLIVNKSTVPVGTGQWMKQLLLKAGCADFTVASCPEFLREGSALHDSLNPDRLIFGIDNPKALEILCDLFKPLIEKKTPVVATNLPTAEMIKYASNAFLATKISFINEIANLCDTVGADALTVAKGMGLDPRISPHFLNPGPGFGGSCFPKDTLALLAIAQKKGIPLPTIAGAVTTNDLQQTKGVEKLKQLIGYIEGKTIAILGLAFKPNTDDIRHSPAIKTIEILLREGACIKAYDPHAQQNMARLFPNITYVDSPYCAAKNADALIILTDDPQFKELDLLEIYEVMRTPILIDARNILKPDAVNALPFRWESIGRTVLTKNR